MHFLCDPSFYVILDNKLIDCMYILAKVVNLNQKITRFFKEYILMSFPAGKLLSVLETPTSLNFILYFVLFFFLQDTMTWSKPAVNNAIPLPRSLHSATTIGKRFVMHQNELYILLWISPFLTRHVHLVVMVPIVNLQIWRKLICLSYWVHVDELFFRQAFYTVPANLKLNSTFFVVENLSE